MIATTNRDLAQEVKDGHFREDLYYRLNVLPIRVPALRERGADIEPLAKHFLTRYARENQSRVKGFANEAMGALQNHKWPGNVRELENLVQRVVVRDAHESVRLQDVLPDLGGPGAALAQHERRGGAATCRPRARGDRADPRDDEQQ